MSHYLHLSIHTVVVIIKIWNKNVWNTICHHLPVIPSWNTQPPQIPPAYSIPCQPLDSWPCFPKLYGLFYRSATGVSSSTSSSTTLRIPSQSSPLYCFLWFPKCMGNPFPLPLFLAKLLVLKHIFLYVSTKYNHITSSTCFSHLYGHPQWGITSINTQCVVAGTEIADISHSTAMYCPQIMKAELTLMTARVDPLPPNLVEKRVGFLKKRSLCNKPNRAQNRKYWNYLTRTYKTWSALHIFNPNTSLSGHNI
jgi:hypothetical protein